MAYQTPRQWAHGDVPTGALMQRYSDSEAALYTYFDTQSAMNVVAWSGEGDDQSFSFENVCRYLHYSMDDGSGVVIDPDNPENSISLSETDQVAEGAFKRVDLRAVGWIYPGKLYFVRGVDHCVEHSEPGVAEE